jgi:nitrous oxidase accessory protein
LFDAQHNRIRHNRVSFVRDGVYFDHADFNVVEDNEFSDLRYGVHYMYCKSNSFFRNIFRDSLGGVAVMYTEGVTFRDNQIFNNRGGYSSFGLLLKDCLDSVAEGNVIVNNVNGIFLDNSHRNRFVGNLIAYNDVGVMLHASSLESVFSGNDFVGNLATLHTVGRADADWTPDGKGNHYSDYMGYDVDGDGIGDTEHALQDAFEYLEGSRPLLRLFLNSAASDALAAAERSFPIVPTSDEKDTAPSMKPVSGAKITYRYDGGERLQDSYFLVAGALVSLFFSGWLCWRLRG